MSHLVGKKRILELSWNIGREFRPAIFSIFFTLKCNLCADILIFPHDLILRIFLPWIELVHYKMANVSFTFIFNSEISYELITVCGSSAYIKAASEGMWTSWL